MNLHENISRVKKLMGIKETLEKLPQDSYVQMNIKNFKIFRKQLTEILKPYLNQSEGDFVKFRNLVVKKMDKFNPTLQDYIPQDIPFLNNLMSGGGAQLDRGLFQIFNEYFNPKDKPKSEKSACSTRFTLDNIRLVGPVTSKSEKDLRNRWMNMPGGRLFRVVLPEECYLQLSPEERAALYVTIEPKENRIHFPSGLPQKLRGSGLGKLIYLKTIQKLGYITSSLGSSPAVKMMYEDFLTNPDYKDMLLGLILQKQLILIDKNTNLDIPEIFRNFVDGKYTEQKYVEASPELKQILGKEYEDWYNQLGNQDIPSLVAKYTDREPKPGDTVIDTRDGKTYMMGYENIHNQGKPNERKIIWLSGDKYKDKYIDASEKSNLKIISPGK